MADRDEARRRDDDEVPVPRFLDQLPEYTKMFLAQCRPEEIETLKGISRLDSKKSTALFRLAELDTEKLDLLLKGLNYVKAFGTVGTLSKWLVISVVTTFLGSMLLWEQFGKFLAMFRDAPK